MNICKQFVLKTKRVMKAKLFSNRNCYPLYPIFIFAPHQIAAQPIAMIVFLDEKV